MIHAVIMAGGSGTRFWPQSRRTRPKQLLHITGENTMIRATVERILPEAPFQRIMVVTRTLHADEIRNQLPELQPEMVVEEPVGRNTAPCIALAAYKIRKKDPDAVMAVLPADHRIGKEKEFLLSLRTAAEAAAAGDYLVTFGIIPHRAETGYGYIKLGPVEMELRGTRVHRVEEFAEKPDAATAEVYLRSGCYMWNSGMFVWKVSSIIKAIQCHLPDIARALEDILPVLNTPDEPEALKEAYENMQSISVDYGILEQARNVLCIAADLAWNDVGSWSSLTEVWDPDKEGNSIQGEALLLDSRNCIVSSPHKLVTLLGVEDLVVVDTPDAIMVCRRDKAQDVKILREELKKRGYDHLL